MTGVIRGWSKELYGVHSSVAGDMDFVEKKELQEIEIVLQGRDYIVVSIDDNSFGYDANRHRFEAKEIAYEAGLEYLLQWL